MATLPPSMSRLSRQCGILNISQLYKPPRPVTRIASLFFLGSSITVFTRAHQWPPPRARLFHTLRGLSLRETYTDRATAACRRVLWVQCDSQNKSGLFLYSLTQWYSSFFVRLPLDVISLQLCTPKVVGVQFKLYRAYNLHLK
jgi:hypothetical protein